MTRWDAKVDQNQREIVQALRDIGADVEITARLGMGFPDLTVGFRGRTYLLEVKMPKGKLTEAEVLFFANWRGNAAVVRSVDDALIAIGAMEE